MRLRLSILLTFLALPLFIGCGKDSGSGAAGGGKDLPKPEAKLPPSGIEYKAGLPPKE
jgi:hypothetical protein